MLRPFVRLTFVLTAAFVLAACTEPDAEQRFNDFYDAAIGSTDDTGMDATGDVPPDTSIDDGGLDGGGGACDPVAAPLDPEGVWFFAVSATLDREKPLYIETTITPNGDTWDFSFQPLTADEVIADDGSTTPRDNPREPVGDPIITSGVTIESSGAFTVTAADITVQGAANPLTGRDIRGTITLTGTLGPLNGCGDVTGEIVEPLTLNLNGSTFAARRVDDGDPNDIDPVLYNCDAVDLSEGTEFIEPEDCGCEPPAFDPVGVYFLAISATLDREKPLFVETTVVAEGDGYAVTFQPLATDEAINDDGSTTPRANPRVPVGSPIAGTNVSIGTDGTFAATAADITVVGDANPLTGRDIRGTINLSGRFPETSFPEGTTRSSDGVCGDVTGEIVEPLTLNLNGSTFAMVRIDDADPNEVDPVVYTCDTLTVPELPCADEPASEE